jgi:hypothetical protein
VPLPANETNFFDKATSQPTQLHATQGTVPFYFGDNQLPSGNTFATGLWRAFRHKEGVKVLPLQNFGL